MKPNTRLISFKLSLLCFGIFLLQLIATRIYIQHIVANAQSTSLVGPLYWLGVLWISLGSTFYYRTTKHRQTPVRQLLVFVLSPLVFAPLIGIFYVIIVLFPLYDLIGHSGIGN